MRLAPDRWTTLSHTLTDDPFLFCAGTVAIRLGLPYPAFQVAPVDGDLYWYTDAAGAALLPEEGEVRAQQEPAGKL